MLSKSLALLIPTALKIWFFTSFKIGGDEGISSTINMEDERTTIASSFVVQDDNFGNKLW